MPLAKNTIPGKTGDPSKLSLGQELGAKLKALSKTLREIMYGFTIHELDMEIRKERGVSTTFSCSSCLEISSACLSSLPTTPSGSCPTSFHLQQLEKKNPQGKRSHGTNGR